MGQTTVSIKNVGRPAPRWFRKAKKATMILAVAANLMIAGWGLPDQLLVTRIQLWCTIGVIALLEALEVLLANGEDYAPTKEQEEIIEQLKSGGTTNE